jgi:dihydrofolate reductase
MISLIVAHDPEGVIGVRFDDRPEGFIPWHHPPDLRRFKQLTMGGVLIMGSKTWKSLPPKGLPGREIIVLSRSVDWGPPELTLATNLGVALHLAESEFPGKPVWIAGGAEVYKEALELGLVDKVELTLVPKVEIAEGVEVVRFPVDLLESFDLIDEVPNSEDPSLVHRTYRCRISSLRPSN